MIFQPELAAKVLSGEKTVTRRKPGKYRAGRSYSVQVPIGDGPGKGRGGKQLARIAVTSVKCQQLGFIFDAGMAEARREGFGSPREFFDYWRGLYGEFDPGLIVDRIEFKLIAPDDYKLWEGSSPALGSSEGTPR